MENIQNLIETEFYITKASLDDDGRMLWAATASDTDPDSYSEKMSLELYESFINRIDSANPPYLSLAHYPRLGGKGEAGVATEVYIQGKQLKAKGYFHDTPLGVSIFNAIRKDRRTRPEERSNNDDRIRISIGFYDRKHSHSNGTVWEYKSGQPCTQCALGIGGKVYLDGVLEHLAVTRVPVNKRTDITAKSESEDMPTRKDDALSIVENPEIVEDIEKAHRESLQAKSETEVGLVERSDGEPSITINNKVLSQSQVLQLFKKLNPDGTFTEDDTSKLVNQILNEITSQSEAEKETAKSEGEYMPFGGAVSMADAREYMQAAKLESNAYYAYSMFGAVANNILCAEDATIADKLSAMQTLLGEFKSYLDPKKLMELSQAEDTTLENKSETSAPVAEIKAESAASTIDIKPLEDRIAALELALQKSETIQQPASVETVPTPVTNSNPVIQSAVDEFTTNLSAAVALSGVERQAALQDVINKAGAKLLEIDRSLSTVDEPVNNSQTVDVNDVVSRAVDEKLAPVNATLAQLGSQLNDIANALRGQQINQSQTRPAPTPIEVPKMKSIALPGPGMAPVSPAKGMTIMDIATQTTFGSGR